jgi:hypothetical protein
MFRRANWRFAGFSRTDTISTETVFFVAGSVTEILSAVNCLILELPPKVETVFRFEADAIRVSAATPPFSDARLSRAFTLLLSPPVDFRSDNVSH